MISDDCGDYVVVVNARHLVVSGEKRVNKIYRHHTGYPGGVKAVPFWMMQERKPEEVHDFSLEIDASRLSIGQ